MTVSKFLTYGENLVGQNKYAIFHLIHFCHQVMRTHGFQPSEDDLSSMIRNVDTNSNGAIDFNEFIEMMVKRGGDVEEDVAHAFKVFDRDGDGLITGEELRLTMNNLGEPITEEEVRDMIAEADIDGDGKINFAEFKSLMVNKALWQNWILFDFLVDFNAILSCFPSLFLMA